jgi:hypothetical protein
MVNDFVLKSMELQTATLDIKDFTYAILMGFLERNLNLQNGNVYDDT